MINVLLSRRWISCEAGRGAIVCLSLAVLFYASNAVMAQPPAAKTPPASASKDAAKAKAAAAADDDQAPAPAPDVANAPVADPSQTKKVDPIEVFKDPNVELLQLLDLNKFKALPAIPFTPTDVLTVKEMAGNKNATIDPALIDRVVRGLAAKLTEKAAIQSLIEMPEEVVKPSAGGALDKAAAKKAAAAAAAAAQARRMPPRPSPTRRRISWNRSSSPGPRAISIS